MWIKAANFIVNYKNQLQLLLKDKVERRKKPVEEEFPDSATYGSVLCDFY